MMTERATDDGLMLIYDILKQDEIVQHYCHSERDGLRIKLFDYPATADVSGSFIVLESILNENPSSFADDTWVTYDYLLHVEVWSKNRTDNRLLANRVRDLLWQQLRFKQNDDVDEFDLGIYRDARRYKGKLHRNDI